MAADFFGIPTKDITAGADVLSAGLNVFSGLEKAAGYDLEANYYKTAAGFAEGNVDLAKEAGAIKQYQTMRRMFETNASQQAELAGNNLAGVSSFYLLRQNLQQGALASGLVGIQSAIEQRGYQAQAAADKSMAAQAEKASTSSTIGAIAGGVLGVAKAALPFFL